MIVFSSILECIFGKLATQPLPPASFTSPEAVASRIVTVILNAEDPYLLERANIPQWLVRRDSKNYSSILRGLENALRPGAEVGRVAADAAARGKDAAIDRGRYCL